MDVLQELNDEQKHVVSTVEDMVERAKTEKRDLTAAELAEIDKLKERSKELDQRIESQERQEETMRWVDVGGETPEDHPIKKFDERFLTCGKRLVFTRDNFGQHADHYAYRAGQWWLALHGRAAAIKWCNDNGVTTEARALQSNINTAGGVTVPTELEQAIIIQREQYGVARRECRVVPVASDTSYWPRITNSVTSYYVGQGSAATESDTTFDSVALNVKELVAFTRVSNVLAEDAIINIGDLVASEFAYSFAKAEDEALFNGDGTSTYGGIEGLRTKLTTAGALAGSVAATSGDDTFAELLEADILTLMGTLPEYAQANAKWYISPVGWSVTMLGIAAAGGGLTFQSYEGGMRRMFYGFPVVVTPSMPNSASDTYDGTVMILFGDMNMAAYLGDRRGISVLASPHRYIEYMQTAYLGSERYAITCHGVGDGTTAGPMVALCGTT
jgi:HK97 family phage major capsid protein